ncbi:IS1595 family transposase [Cereibacter sphaeroides]|uniref:IS1595 family transposase n=1 Tax=Cereibacter sphaeroides TaxID=1063 RepID=UPI001F1E01B2|nr:IS1595 family transposase [Cereibacter sphaeroides]MCE6949475.1 IS1595 family transposase [Cereibacter sphaeroides]
MANTTIQHLMNRLRKVAARDLIAIESFVAELVQTNAISVALERRVEKTDSCPICGAKRIQKWGKSNAGTQRFNCRDCGKTFGATNGTAFYRLRRRALWTRYLGLMGQHISLRDLQEKHGFKQSLSTLHRWRYRFLASLAKEPGDKLAGLIEADEKFFRTSFKGSRGWRDGNAPQQRKPRKRGGASQRGLGQEQVPTLTAMDRSGVIRQVRLPDLKWLTIAGELKSWVEPASVICSDGNLAYKTATIQSGCEHIVAKGRQGHNAAGLSIGRIDAYHRDVENLINRRCMGVSTRYLMNYFGWARRMKQHKPFGNEWLVEMLLS